MEKVKVTSSVSNYFRTMQWHKFFQIEQRFVLTHYKQKQQTFTMKNKGIIICEFFSQ